MKLNVNEIFYSIQGETTTTGFPSLFIRLTGCNLHCRYCDTEYAREEGTMLTVEQILTHVENFPEAHHITLTGGEPLCQEGAGVLISRLCDLGYRLQIETNGSVLLKDIDTRARKIIDIKTPSSGEADSFLMENIEYLTEKDEIKFVLGDDEDYRFARDFFSAHLTDTPAVISFSPIYGHISYAELADCILADRLPVRLNIQLHKMIGLESEKEKRIKILQ